MKEKCKASMAGVFQEGTEFSPRFRQHRGLGHVSQLGSSSVEGLSFTRSFPLPGEPQFRTDNAEALGLWPPRPPASFSCQGLDQSPGLAVIYGPINGVLRDRASHCSPR